MSEKRKRGFVSLEGVLENLSKAEDALKRGAASSEGESLEQGISLLKEIKENLTPLSEEKDDLDLDMIIENIENAILELSEKPDIPKAIASIKSAKSNLIGYNLKGRKSF